jgi:hypothetical protein
MPVRLLAGANERQTEGGAVLALPLHGLAVAADRETGIEGDAVPFVDRYGTVCLAPPPEIRAIFTSLDVASVHP